MKGFEESYFRDMYNNKYALHNPRYKFVKLLGLIKKKGKLLDVGCAFGRVLAVGKEIGYKTYGCDVSRFAVKACRKNGLQARVCSIGELKYAKDSFDVVTVLDVIEHVKDIEGGLAEIRRVCRGDGLVLFVMPVYDGVTGKIVNMLDKDQTHINKFSRYEWLRMLSRQFEVVKWGGIMRYFFFNRWYLHYQTQILRPITPAIFVLCKNKKV